MADEIKKVENENEEKEDRFEKIKNGAVYVGRAIKKAAVPIASAGVGAVIGAFGTAIYLGAVIGMTHELLTGASATETLPETSTGETEVTES